MNKGGKRCFSHCQPYSDPLRPAMREREGRWDRGTEKERAWEPPLQTSIRDNGSVSKSQVLTAFLLMKSLCSF